MSKRTFERASARTLYAQFARSWRKQLRDTGLYGKPGSPKRPTFAQWNAMHERNLGAMRESTPQDVTEYLGVDPWGGEAAGYEKVVSEEPKEERGVVEIPIAGDDE